MKSIQIEKVKNNLFLLHRIVAFGTNCKTNALTISAFLKRSLQNQNGLHINMRL